MSIISQETIQKWRLIMRDINFQTGDSSRMTVDNREIKVEKQRDNKWLRSVITSITIGLIIFVGQWILTKYILK